MSDILATIMPALAELATAALALGGLALIQRVRDWIGLQVDDRTRGYLTRAIDNGLARAALIHKDSDSASFAEKQKAAAVDYVAAQVPDALTRLGIDRDALSRLVEAHSAQNTRNTF